MDALFPEVASATAQPKKAERRFIGLVVNAFGETLSSVNGADQVDVMTRHKVAVERMQRHGRKDVFSIYGEMQKI